MKGTTTGERPRIVVSQCLGFEKCRYNGDGLQDRFLEAITPFVEFLPICPEVEIGLGTPRAPVRLVSLDKGESTQLFQPESGKNLTEAMLDFSATYLSSLPEIDGFVLKSASPSCARQDAKVYGGLEKSPALGRGPGLFAAEVEKRFPLAAIEDEGRLKNQALREHFLTRIFAARRFRAVKDQSRRRALVEFHTRNKYLLMAYNQTRMRELGRVVAGQADLSLEETLRQYQEGFLAAFKKVPRRLSNINVLMHGFGYVSKHLSRPEVDYFLSLLEEFRNQRIPLSSPISVLKSWLVRFEVEYLMQQSYFAPFPEELISIKDSGKGRVVT